MAREMGNVALVTYKDILEEIEIFMDGGVRLATEGGVFTPPKEP